MHIVLVHQAFAALDEAGGTRHYELARCLVQRGHLVTVIASPVSYLTGKTRKAKMQWVDRQEPEPGITILRCYTYAAIHKSFFHRILGFLSFMVSSFIVGLGVKNVSLVWGTSPPIFQGITAWLLARLKGAPFLFEVRDLWPAFAIAIGVLKNPLLVRASLWLERFLYHRADRVMVNSPGFMDHVRSRGAKQVVLIPNGADPDMFHPSDTGAAFRQQNGLDGQYIVLYAGAHGISNDLDVVLQAAARLKYTPNIRFLLVGDGKEKANLTAKAKEMGLENITFLPPVAKEGMSEVMAAADACIAILKPLELYKTTYPNKVFDYMAAGRPTVLAIDGVIREVVESTGAGIAIPPGSPEAMAAAVRELAADPQKGRAMGQAGRRAIETSYNRHEMAEQLARLVDEIRGERDRKNPGR